MSTLTVVKTNKVEEIFSNYISRLEKKNAENTVKIYRKAIEFFIQDFEIIDVDEIESLSLGLYQDWADLMLERYGGKTVKTYFNSVRIFLNFLDKYAHFSDGFRLPNLSLIDIPVEKKDVIIIDDGDLALILGVGVKKQQDRVLVRFLYYTGKRRGDIAKIKLEDIKLSPENVWELHIEKEQKTGKSSITFLPDDSMKELEIYLENERIRLGLESIPSHFYLFGAHGKVIESKRAPQSQNIRNRTVSIKKLLGISKDKKITPHIFRHTVMTKVLEEVGLVAATQFGKFSTAETVQKFYWGRKVSEESSVGQQLFG